MRVVQALALDDRGDGGRNVVRDEPPAEHARGLRPVELEEEHALGSGDPREHRLEALARMAGACRHREPREPQHLVGLLPREEVGKLVGADEEDRVRPLRVCAQRVDRARVLVEDDVVAGERGARELQPRRRRRLDALVPGIRADEDEHALEPELLLRRAQQRDVPVVRRIERAAEDRGHAADKLIDPRRPIPRRAHVEFGVGIVCEQIVARVKRDSKRIPQPRSQQLPLFPVAVRAEQMPRAHLRLGSVDEVLDELAVRLCDRRRYVFRNEREQHAPELLHSFARRARERERGDDALVGNGKLFGCGEVDLVQHNDLRTRLEPGPVRGELDVDRPPLLLEWLRDV